MRKKTNSIIVLCLLAGFIITLTACGKTIENKEIDNAEAYTVYMAYAKSGGMLSYEEWLGTIKGERGDGGIGITSITKTDTEGLVDTYTITFTDGTTTEYTITNGARGEKGDQGEKGEQGIRGEAGEPGADGHTSIITIGENGNWFIDGIDTKIKAQGPQGEQGIQGDQGDTGEQGPKGETGRGIAGVYVDNEGYLVIVYSDDTEQIVYKINNMVMHEHEIEKTEIVERIATCSETGMKYIVCKTCGELLQTVIIEKVPHAFEKNGVCGICGYDSHSTPALIYEEIMGKEEYRVVGLSDAVSTVYIPDSYNSLPVTEIANAAFANDRNITAVVIADSVKTIGISALSGCSALTSVHLPPSLKEIKANTFQGSAIKSIVIPDSVTSIGGYAFDSCCSLTSIVFSGTRDQWNAIEKGSYWDYNTGDYTVRCSDGVICGYCDHAIEYNGNRYCLFVTHKSWSEAKEYCESLGGHLATITSAEEQAFIEANFSGNYWLGATDEETEGVWKWITGEEWIYSNWGDGEPNNMGGEDYLVIWPRYWNDLCDDSYEQSGFICEWEGE